MARGLVDDRTAPGYRGRRNPTYRCSVCDLVWDMRVARSGHEGCAVRWADGSIERAHPVREGREG